MASLNTKVRLYLEANGKTSSEIGAEGSNVQLVNEGSGDIIKVWDVSGVAEPTAEQLATYDSTGNTEETNANVRITRRNAYGDIGDQLDEIYKDIDAWKARIQQIKTDNPKS
jgi:hypothetical protein